MSIKKFQEARGNLAFSQGLLDRIRGTNMAQQSQSMGQPTDTPQQQPTAQQPQESPQEEQQEQNGIIQGVVDAITPMFDAIKEKLSKPEPQEAVLKVPATMEPKE